MSCPKNERTKNKIKTTSQEDFYRLLLAKKNPTGVRVDNSAGNEYLNDPFHGADPFHNSTTDKALSNVSHAYTDLDLNIDNYSQPQLYDLFGITTQHLDAKILKVCRKIVHKTHPDKSGIDPKFFVFFMKALKRITMIYEFQNKNSSNKSTNTEYSTEDDISKAAILDKHFQKHTALRDGSTFNMTCLMNCLTNTAQILTTLLTTDTVNGLSLKRTPFL